MDLKNLETGVMSFAENEILPNLTNSLDRWLMYAGLTAGGINLEGMLASYAPMLQQIGIMDNMGEINLDRMEEIAAAAFAKQPTVKIWKITFNENDFRKFMAHLRNGGTGI